jgi:hypothetical protein
MQEPLSKFMGAPSLERRAELMALLQKNPDRNPETGAPSGNTPAAPAASPMKLVGGRFGGGFGGITTPTSIPSTSTVTTGNSKAPAADGRAAAQFGAGKVPSVNTPAPAESSKAKDFIDAVNAAFPDMTHGGPIDVRRSPITGLPTPKAGESPAKPFLDAANQPLPDMTHGGPIDVSRSPITGLPTPKVKEAPKPIDMEAAKALFQRTHGSFDAKSKVDQAKMKGIMDLMNTPEAAFMSPNQFAMQIYKNQKPRK